MKILVTGSSGLVGSALVPFLTSKGHEVVRLVRRQPDPGASEVRWDPEAGYIDSARLQGVEAAVHLAGENLASGRWTARRKARILGSRVKGTRLLSETLAKLEPRPFVLASASAMGYYGDSGDRILKEDSPPGADFLATVCRQWEGATEAANQAGIRVAYLRSGLIFSPKGGVLAKMLPVFKLGLGGKLGSGRHYISWIALDDHVRAIYHILTTGTLRGPVNVSTPNPVTNAEFTRALGRALSRPTILPVPAFVLRVALGEMADSLLASIRTEPSKLLDTGFQFQHPALEPALREVLRPASSRAPGR